MGVFGTRIERSSDAYATHARKEKKEREEAVMKGSRSEISASGSATTAATKEACVRWVSVGFR